MKFLWKTLLITGIIFAGALCAPETLGAEGEKDVIRVGLSNSAFSTFEFIESTVITTDSAVVQDISNGAKADNVPQNAEIQVVMRNGLFFVTVAGKEVLKNAKGPVLIVSKGKLGIKGLNRKGNPAYYRGMIEFKAVQNGGKFNIINILDSQTYLKGVVPNEMPVSFGLNALKAQAVAARNYANRPQNIYKNYDICDSTACQVYYGANSENQLSDRAVDETQGIFALYNSGPILALYSSTGGGVTEDYETVYGSGTTGIFGGQRPYLKSVKDSDSLKKPVTEEELKEFYSNNVPSFDVKSPKHRWEVKFDRFELEETLTKTLREQSLKGLVYPAFGENDEVFGLEDIRAVKRGESGKIIDLEIRAVSGVWRVKKELGIRRVLKKGKSILWSANFVTERVMPTEEEVSSMRALKTAEAGEKNENEKNDNETENILKDGAETPEKPSKNNENDSNSGFLANKESKKACSEPIFSFLKPENSESVILNAHNPKNDKDTKIYFNALNIPLPKAFTFIGAGFGHGVGMSQYGAGYLAANGVGYDEILKHYYTGITLGTMPREVLYNNYKQNYIQTIYVDGVDSTTAGTLPGDIDKNPLKEELSRLYNNSKKPAKYILNIDNSKNPTELEFYINDVQFTPNMQGFWGKTLKMDITKYLKRGKNTITFYPLKPKDKEKTTAFWVEIVK